MKTISNGFEISWDLVGRHLTSYWKEAYTPLIPINIMMTPSNGNIFRVTGPLCGEFTGHRSQRPVTRNFDVFFDLHLNKRLSKQSQGWWFEMPSCPLWRHSNMICISDTCLYVYFRLSSMLTSLRWHIEMLTKWPPSLLSDDIFKCIFLRENCCILI